MLISSVALKVSVTDLCNIDEKIIIFSKMKYLVKIYHWSVWLYYASKSIFLAQNDITICGGGGKMPHALHILSYKETE